MIFDFLTKAKDLFYSNKSSGLSATNVQGAIDEVKGSVNTNTADIANMLSALKSAGINENILSANMIPNNLSFANLIAKNTVTFFTVLKDSNFPNNYGSGVLIPQADTTVKYIYYTAYNVLYTGRVVDGAVTWDEKTSKSALESVKLMSGCNWNTPFDLKPTSGGLERLGGCYISDSTQVTNYHAPSTGYAFAFGERVERYSIIFISFDGKKMWYTNCHISDWIEIYPNNTALTVWENSNPTAGYDSGTITFDSSGYSEFEVVYADVVNSTLIRRRSTGRMPISNATMMLAGFKALNSNLGEGWGYSTREYQVTNSSIVFNQCHSMNICTEDSDSVCHINTSNYCVPLKVILY